jgi:hypothetical protein
MVARREIDHGHEAFPRRQRIVTVRAWILARRTSRLARARPPPRNVARLGSISRSAAIYVRPARVHSDLASRCLTLAGLLRDLEIVERVAPRDVVRIHAIAASVRQCLALSAA